MLYIRGKENGEMLRDSIEHGPYKFKSKITVKDTNSVTDIRRAERLKDHKGDDKLRYENEIKAVNILLLGLPSPPLQSYAPSVVQQPPTFQVDTGLAIPTFLPTNDPIASLSKELKLQFKMAKSRFRMFKVNSLKVMRAMLEISKLQEHRVKDFKWFKDKMLLDQAQEAGVVLDEEQQDFLADSLEETDDCEDLQIHA
ncbi:hypothetical protein Tco_0180627 [Tanacetum coccineum]